MGSQHFLSQYSEMDRLSNSEFIKVWHYFLGRRHKLYIEHIPYHDCNHVKSVSLHFLIEMDTILSKYSQMDRLSNLEFSELVITFVRRSMLCIQNIPYDKYEVC